MQRISPTCFGIPTHRLNPVTGLYDRRKWWKVGFAALPVLGRFTRFRSF